MHISNSEYQTTQSATTLLHTHKKPPKNHNQNTTSEYQATHKIKMKKQTYKPPTQTPNIPKTHQSVIVIQKLTQTTQTITINTH